MDKEYLFKPICLFLLFMFTRSGVSQSLISEEQFSIFTPYEQASNLVHYMYDSISYEQARSQREFEFVRFTYESDGNQVEGFLCRPSKPATTKFPVILYNRGGTGNYGKVTEADLPNLYRLAQNGFIVLASNYRYVGARGPEDQLGGDDIKDIVSLYDLLPSIHGVDTTNVFMMGVSRGGLMTYSAMTRIRINAGAVIGGVSNYFLLSEKRPEFLNGWNDLSMEENYRGLKNVLPHFETNKVKYLTERSPVMWAEEIKSPILILHSRQDGFVTCDHALEMASALQTSKKQYQLKIYEEKSHSLPYQYFDSYVEIVDWFKKFMK